MGSWDNVGAHPATAACSSSVTQLAPPPSTLLLLIGSQPTLLQLHTASSHCFSKTGSHIFPPDSQQPMGEVPQTPSSIYCTVLPSQDPGLFLYSVNMQGAFPNIQHCPAAGTWRRRPWPSGGESQALYRPSAPGGQDDFMSITVALLETWESIKSLSLCLRIYTRTLMFLLVPSFGD